MIPLKSPLPWWEGMKGRGKKSFCPPPPLPTGRQAHPPPSKGEGKEWEVSNIFG